MRVRITNNSEVDSEDISSVKYELVKDTYVIIFYDTTVKRVRAITLTDDGRTFLQTAVGQQ